MSFRCPQLGSRAAPGGVDGGRWTCQRELRVYWLSPGMGGEELETRFCLEEVS